MANLTAQSPRNYQRPLGMIIDFPMDAAKIWEGSAVSDKNATNVARTLNTGENFLGFANATVDNSAGVAGGTTIGVVTNGFVQVAVTGLLANSLGTDVYMSDGNTFTLSSNSGSNSLIGRVVKIVSLTTLQALVHFEGIELVDEYAA